jgi:hypothetical protein
MAWTSMCSEATLRRCQGRSLQASLACMPTQTSPSARSRCAAGAAGAAICQFIQPHKCMCCTLCGYVVAWRQMLTIGDVPSEYRSIARHLDGCCSQLLRCACLAQVLLDRAVLLHAVPECVLHALGRLRVGHAQANIPWLCAWS